MRKSAALGLALLGLFVSLYLWWIYASPSHAMVCIGGGCDAVRASRYSHVFGYPVPMYGTLFYAALALLILVEPLVAAQGTRFRSLIAAFAAAGFAVAAGLTAIEAFVVHAFCAWCVVQAVAITLLLAIWLTLPAVVRFTEPRRELQRHALVLLVAIAAAVPAFTLLRRHAELPPPPAPALTMQEAQRRLVRPDSHVTGNPQALVTLVEFGDMQCPACVAAHPTMEKLRQQFADRVRFVFRQFPLETIHQYSLGAAEASECAGAQGKFWQALDRFYKAEGDLQLSSLERYAGELGLDMSKYRACMADPATAARVQRDMDDGHALGVRATPTFFVGKQRIEGPMDLDLFSQLLEREITSASVAASLAQLSKPEGPAADAQHGSEPRATQPATKPAAQTGGGFGASGPLAFDTVKGSATDCSEIAPAGPEPKLIHTADAQASFRKGALFVDVRAAGDFARSHIEGARNLPLLEAARRAPELPKNRPIVLYEGSGGSSNDACAASRAVGRVLLSRGFKDVVVYQDGLAGWQKAALPTAQ
jgi:protein-disulfide isomerase/rhodanese-related sulfurtransferase